MDEEAAREDSVRRQAYQLWEIRGRGQGHDEEDWLAAEIVLKAESLLGQRLSPLGFRCIGRHEIFSTLAISHAQIHDFFYPSASWIETEADIPTIFDFDQNRALHFDEGFLTACRRVAGDPTIQTIAAEHHFPYRELTKLRQHISEVKMCYREGASIPPPLFFYPAPGQLEILDGVHRCLAAYTLWEEAVLNAPYRVWVGFDHTTIEAGVVVQQIWVHGLRRVVQSLEHRAKPPNQGPAVPMSPTLMSALQLSSSSSERAFLRSFVSEPSVNTP